MRRGVLQRLIAHARPLVASAWLRASVPFLSLGMVAACSTPSVPLPPPVVDVTALTFSKTSDGLVVLTGVPRPSHAHAVFYVLDQKSGDGVIATAAADGSFTTPPFAFALGGVAELYFVDPEGVRSESTCVTIEVSAPLFGATCQ